MVIRLYLGRSLCTLQTNKFWWVLFCFPCHPPCHDPAVSPLPPPSPDIPPAAQVRLPVSLSKHTHTVAGTLVFGSPCSYPLDATGQMA